MDSAIRHAIAPLPNKSFTCFQAVLCQSCDASHFACPPFCEDFYRLPLCFSMNTTDGQFFATICLYRALPNVHPDTGALVNGSWNGGLLIHTRTRCPIFKLKTRRFKRLSCCTSLPIGRPPAVKSFGPRKPLNCFASLKTEHSSSGNRLDREEALLVEVSGAVVSSLKDDC